MYLSDIFTIAVNLAGIPAMSIPIGFANNGMPAGLQIMGNYFEESKLLNVAHQYQQVTDWHKQLPEEFKIMSASNNGLGAWEVVIGLEIHAQLATKSKIFSGASTAYGAEPNTQTSVVDIALPGVLPVLNKEAVYMAVKIWYGDWSRSR